MAQSVEEIMTPNPTTIPASAPIAAAARAMREFDIGDVVVLEESKPCGILTDRDLVVRGMALGKDPETTMVADICSRDLTTVSRKDSAEDVTRLMQQKSLRRIPVVDKDMVLGVVSIGDLAVRREPQSTLGRISAAAPNR